jgi:hypothetical protein
MVLRIITGLCSGFANFFGPVLPAYENQQARTGGTVDLVVKVKNGCKSLLRHSKKQYS